MMPEVKIPKMYNVRQCFNNACIEDIETVVAKEISKSDIKSRIKKKVGLLIGSRGINCIDRIVLETVKQIKCFGAEPIIIPSMGSHGGATAEGQKHILSSYGITEESMGCPITATMDVVKTGEVNGVKTYADSVAMSCDCVIPINRVKPHTDFRGNVESGLCKMLSIGVGNQIGCSNLHNAGFENFHWLIPEVAKVNIDALSVCFGIAIVENAYDKTFMIKAIPSENILSEEPKLLKIAKAHMPRIRVKDIDLLIVDEIGKDISGSGLDPNITGRTWCGSLPEFDGANIKRILVKGLSEKTNGNATGIGYADFALKSCIDSIDMESTKINIISSNSPMAGRLPIAVDNEKEGITLALLSAPHVNLSVPKIVRIKNTLSLTEIQVSEALLEEISQNKNNRILGEVING